MPFPDPYDAADKTVWQERAEAVEYWIMGALFGGALVYGIFIGLRDLARLVGL
jgi:hypothetical protein